MARGSKALSFSIELTPDQVFAAVMANSELQAGVVAQFQQGIGSGKRTAGTSTTRRSPSGRVRRGAHHEMAIKALAACGAKNAEKSVPGKEIKAKAAELGHSFGSTLNATLDALALKGIVQYKDVSKKGAGKKRYTWWLKGTEKESLDAISKGNNEEAN